MFEATKGERAALALLDYVVKHKSDIYLKIDASKFSRLPRMRNVARTEEIETRFNDGYPYEYPYSIVRLPDYEAHKRATYLHIADSESLQINKKEQEFLENELLISIPVATPPSAVAAQSNAFQGILKNFFLKKSDALLTFEPHFEEVKPGEYTLQITYKQYEFLKDYANKRTTSRLKGFIEKVSERQTGDFSDILKWPEVTLQKKQLANLDAKLDRPNRTKPNGLDPTITELAADPTSSNIEALVRAGKLVTAAELDRRREAKLAKKDKGDGTPERS
ncbi:MAG: hypothetical protein U1E36_06025 [Rickettsiales bacterium]